MKAMVFAAGLGTRLRPFTLEHPKALVPVGGVPMLERVLIHLRDSGISDIVVNVHHFAPQIVDFLKSKNNFGLNLSISDESDLLLDTGGGVLKAASMLAGTEEILLYNADILCDLDIAAMLEQHRRTGANVTLLCSQRQTSRYLCFDDADKRLHGWINKSTGECRPDGFSAEGYCELAFDGVHIISAKVLDHLAAYGKSPKFSITPFYIDSCRQIDIRAFVPSANFNWFDVGRPESLALAESFVNANNNI